MSNGKADGDAYATRNVDSLGGMSWRHVAEGVHIRGEGMPKCSGRDRDARLPKPFPGCWQDARWSRRYKTAWMKIRREDNQYHVSQLRQRRETRRFEAKLLWAVKKVLRENRIPERAARRSEQDIASLYGVRKVYSVRRDSDARS